MVLRGEHDRRCDQASAVPSPPAAALSSDHPLQTSRPARCASQAGDTVLFCRCVAPPYTHQGECLYAETAQSGAALFLARRHPACLPRAELLEAG